MEQKSGATQRVTKWKSETINVDIESGVIISKRLMERDYIKIKTIKKYEINGTYGIIKRTNECKRNNQLDLF